jgi:hypothetical protein
MKREKLAPFALGFLAGLLFMLLAGGTVGGALTYTMYQRALAEHERAAAFEQEVLSQRTRDEERMREALQQERIARQLAEDLKREAERLREKP